MTFANILIPVALDQAYCYRIPEGMNISLGDIVRVSLGAREVCGAVWEYPVVPPTGQTIKPVLGKEDLPALPQTLRSFIDWVAWYTLAPKGLVLAMSLKIPEKGHTEAIRVGIRLSGNSLPERMTAARKRVLKKAESGLVFTKKELSERAGVSISVIDGLVDSHILETVIIPQAADYPAPDPFFTSPQLNSAQQDAVSVLCRKISDKDPKPLLLHGVTGSGKTEVYFEAVAEALSMNRQTLILMPEIALTTQFTERFASRFGTNPAIWHSGISGRKRERLYDALATGKVPVLAGARSALFLPFQDLGLIIVDEEHEAAYKQEDRVHYHARDMAVLRARFEKAAVILASATPSLETQINVERERYDRVCLPERFGGRGLPAISAIDLRKDAPDKGHWLSPRLIEETAQSLEKKEQVLFYLNRRGYAPLTLCSACGHRYECPHCSSWLVEHRNRRALLCHLCGYMEPKQPVCPECGSCDSLVSCGPGVERIAEETAKIFPSARRIILSSDLTGGNERLRSELEAVARCDYDIIIGTQLVAKGHNFPHLALVGVIDADIGMSSGDPRASERTFQMLQQVAGRSGRGETPGRAFLQTWQPSHPVIQALLSGNEKLFYRQEQAARIAADMPPAGKLAAIIISGRDKPATEAAARNFARAAFPDPRISILGPVEAPLSQIRGRYRYRILLKTSRQVSIQNYLRHWLQSAEKPQGGIRITIDVDPYSFI